jgi:hypothetical protein
VTAISNRENNVSYLWVFPDGSISDKENPPAFSLGYGNFSLILLVTDNITGEVESDVINIQHAPIPKSSKKSSSQKYTLDIKEVPQDIGGGVVPDIETPFDKLWENLLTLFVLSLLLLPTYAKKL